MVARNEFIAAPRGLVAINSGLYETAQNAEVIAAEGFSPDAGRKKRANKLPKTAITGVCGNLIGN